MKILSLTMAIGLILSGAAYADDGHEGDGGSVSGTPTSVVNNNTAAGGTGIGVGGSGGSSSSTANGGAGGAGGAGGQGGAGGNASGGTAIASGGTGIGGSVTDNSKTTNTNTALGGNSNSNATGGSVKNSGNNTANGGNASLNNSGNSSLKNSGNSSATGGAGGNATISKGAVVNTTTNNNAVSGGTASLTVAHGAVENTNSQSNSVGNTTSTSQVGDTTATATGNGNGSNNTSTNYEAPKIPVATAYSAALTSGMDTCLGSVSGGAQTQILGLTIGGTKIDKNCVLIKQTALLNSLGHARAACLRMQMGAEGAEIKQAMKDAGDECPPLVTPAPVVTVVPADAVTHQELNNAMKHAAQK